MLIQLFNWLPQMIYALVGIYFYFFFRRFMTLFSWKRKAWPVVLSVSRKSAEELFQEVNPDSYVVMLDHHPVDGKINARLGVNLQLSGHTHAGQIFPMGQISYALGINEQNYGMETKGTFHRIVSSGMGGEKNFFSG